VTHNRRHVTFVSPHVTSDALRHAPPRLTVQRMVLTHLRFGLLLGAFVPLPTAAAVVLHEVPVRVYDTTGIALPTRTSALETARVTLVRAGVPIRWLQCAAREHVPACEKATAGGELVLRLVRSGGSGRAVASGAAALRSPVSLLPLGDAFVDLGTQSGVLATVYLDRVTALADASASSVATLLGYAIAHEIGHLLLGSNTHGERGLMRPLWSRDELRRGRASDWTFTAPEVQAIRARLAGTRVMDP
jgi:hypothetical protein